MGLISADELAQRIADGDDVVVCDVRWYLDDAERGRREYDEGHLPGARFVDLHHDLAGTTGGGRHPLPTVAEFGDVVGRLGIRPATLVVAYDAAGGATASRLWWMLRSIGHSQVAVLDGGIRAWVESGHELTQQTPDVHATQYPAAPEWTGVVDVDAVAQSIDFGGTLVDARAPERYSGQVEPIDARAGHIPTAINKFHLDLLGPDGRHKSTADLAEMFSDVPPNAIVYCGSGVTACHALLAMSTIGRFGDRLYAGSWSDWSSRRSEDDDRSVAAHHSGPEGRSGSPRLALPALDPEPDQGAS